MSAPDLDPAVIALDALYGETSMGDPNRHIVMDLANDAVDTFIRRAISRVHGGYCTAHDVTEALADLPDFQEAWINYLHEDDDDE